MSNTSASLRRIFRGSAAFGALTLAMGAAVAQTPTQPAVDTVADCDSAADLKTFFGTIQQLHAAGRLLAYHDRSDGGLLVTLAEMCFAGGCGLSALLDDLGDDALAVAYAEEAGAVIQVRATDREAVLPPELPRPRRSTVSAASDPVTR